MTTCPCCHRLMRNHCPACEADCDCAGVPAAARHLETAVALRVEEAFQLEAIEHRVEDGTLHVTRWLRFNTPIHVASIVGSFNS